MTLLLGRERGVGERVAFDEREDRVPEKERVARRPAACTAEQGANGVGLDAQREAIEAEAERRGWQLVRIEEDRLSGKSLNRPGLTRALKACKSGEVSGIVVAKLDRLSRSLI